MRSLLVCCFLLPVLLSAQENYEIQVYAAPTMAKRQTIFEVHSNYTIQGGKDIVKGVLPSYHSVHETIESHMASPIILNWDFTCSLIIHPAMAGRSSAHI